MALAILCMAVLLYLDRTGDRLAIGLQISLEHTSRSFDAKIKEIISNPRSSIRIEEHLIEEGKEFFWFNIVIPSDIKYL
jgi:hypothetical protein